MEVWRDAGVVERAGLENRYTRKGIGGSNPSPAANFPAGSRKTGIPERVSEVRIPVCRQAGSRLRFYPRYAIVYFGRAKEIF